MTTVHLSHVTKHFGPTVAVEDFSLEVADGEFVTLLGPSGCGKTTTLRMLAGLVEPTGGRILFDDQEVTWLAPRARNIGFVFQAPALFPHLSVADNIGFGLSVKRRDKAFIRQRVDEMLALVELDGYGKRLPAQLSGGQQQRVALARVLATDPRVLLFDEPLSALDKNLRDTLKYSILDLQRKTQKTAIYVTHDQSEAFAISDRIVVMNAGRIEQIGTQTEIYLHPRTPFVAEFIGANNGLTGTVVSVDGSGDQAVVAVRSAGLDLRRRGRTGLTPGQAVLAYIRPEDISVLDDGDDGVHLNTIEGTIDRLIFEGASAQLRVEVAGVEMRADISGGQRLALVQREGRIRLGFDEVTLIAAEGRAGTALPAEGPNATAPDATGPAA
jgi:putative spermidine/putrescine transport system ATP-binding protein